MTLFNGLTKEERTEIAELVFKASNKEFSPNEMIEFESLTKEFTTDELGQIVNEYTS